MESDKRTMRDHKSALFQPLTCLAIYNKRKWSWARRWRRSWCPGHVELRPQPLTLPWLLSFWKRS